jgi:hypothetical protein
VAVIKPRNAEQHFKIQILRAQRTGLRGLEQPAHSEDIGRNDAD